MPKLDPSQFKDANFAAQYFSTCEDGNALTQKLREDDLVLNSSQLLVDLSKALIKEQTKTPEGSDAKAQISAIEDQRETEKKNREEQEKLLQEQKKEARNTEENSNPLEGESAASSKEVEFKRV